MNCFIISIDDAPLNLWYCFKITDNIDCVNLTSKYPAVRCLFFICFLKANTTYFSRAIARYDGSYCYLQFFK